MSRIRQLDGVRALAILAVFVHHALHVKLMWMGVDLFFILSGFLITGVLLDIKDLSFGQVLARFYERRARRILIPYAVFLAVATLFVGVAWMRYWYMYVLLTNFLTPLHIPHPSAFEVLWSLAVEEQFYLVWPFAVYFLSYGNLRRLCLFLIVLAPVLRGTLHFSEHWIVYMLTPFRMDLLAIGGLLCLEWRQNPARIRAWGAKIGIPLSFAGIALLFGLSRFGYSTDGNTAVGNVLIYEGCLATCFGMMLYALGGRGIGWLQWPPLTYIGRVSYSMYLIHTGVIALVFMQFHGLAGAAIALALTLGYATVSWYVLERRLLSRRKI